jgi:Ribbon-helix-helix protein, copG family
MAYGTIWPVEKTTVYLDTDLRRGLQALARRTGRPQADLIREAVRAYLSDQRRPGLPSWIGMVSTDLLDSTKVDEYREEWGRDLIRRKAGE